MPDRAGRAVFMGANQKLKSYGARGTPTGRTYTLPASGDWVHEDDESFLMGLVTNLPCCKGENTFRYTMPSAADMKRVPAWAYEPRPEPAALRIAEVVEEEAPPTPEGKSKPRRRRRSKRSSISSPSSGEPQV